MKIALVLGSGGARGYAHIGVIRELERRGHEVVMVSGTSMGALIGGVYAAGVLDDVTEYATSLSTADVRRLADVTLRAPGLIRLRKAMDKLEEFISDIRIEELPIPYVAVATDINHAREVWFRTGPLIKAIRASIAIPAVFTPVQSGDRLFVDGGLLNPLPLGPTLDSDADLIVAVSLFGPSATQRRTTPQAASADNTSSDEPATWADRIEASFADTWAGRQLQQLLDHGDSHPPEQLFSDVATTATVGLPDITIRALDLMQGQIEIARTAMSTPDVLIRVPVDTCTILEFDRAAEVIDVGHRLAVEALDAAGL
ncbi:MAG: patatin-like phospholipase family protein [Propioniciclava sp.]